MAVSALELSGLIWRGIVAGIGVQCLAAVKATDVADLSENNWPETVTDAAHCSEYLVFRNCLGDVSHLRNDFVGSILCCGKQVNALILREPNVRVFAAGGNAVNSEFVDTKSLAGCTAF